MKKTVKRYLAILLSVMLVVCSMPFATFAASTASVNISSNITNGVEDDNVSFDYLVAINGELYNGTVNGSDSKSYDIVDGLLTMPYDVSASIDLNDGDSYKVKRLAYSDGKYKYVEASDEQSGVISTTSYFVTVDGVKTEISQSEYDTATDNGANTVVILYADANGNNYTTAEVGNISGYYVERKTGLSTTYSLNDYSGYYVVDSLEEHSFNISDVSCTHSRSNSSFMAYSFSNSLTGYYDGVADGAKTASGSSQTNLNTTKTNCSSNLSSNSMRAYYDHTNYFEEQGIMAIVADNAVVSCGCTDSGVNKNSSVYGTYENPVIENTIYAFTEVSERTYEYSAEENENPSVNCIFDIALIIPTALLKVEVTDCKGNEIPELTYVVTNSDNEEITLTDGSAYVPFGVYDLTVNATDGYKVMEEHISDTVTTRI